jgi:adenine-specific DNA methylase
MSKKRRLLIEEWLPAAAIGVECMRERSSASALAPTTFMHVWWARRPLCASRAAVLGSLLPADFPRDVFERLLGFYTDSESLVRAEELVNVVRAAGLGRIPNPHGMRAFRARIDEADLKQAHSTMQEFWGDIPSVIDTMAGGGSIPLESARLGLRTYANELNPVACTILEATVVYPFKFGQSLHERSRYWAKRLCEAFNARMSPYYKGSGNVPPHTYIFTRTVPDPNVEGNPPTPLVPDWHLMNANGKQIVANPIVDLAKKTWRVEIRTVGNLPGDLRKSPPASYKGGTGYSLFTPPLNSKGEVTAQGRPIDGDWIKSAAQSGKMGSTLYAVAYKTARGLEFRPPTQTDLDALAAAEDELRLLRPDWEKRDIIPTEQFPMVASDMRPRLYGMPRWADLFTPRQLLAMGVLVDELQKLRPEIIAVEGPDKGDAVAHLLAFGIDKFLNFNCNQTRWQCSRAIMVGKMDRHDYAFKTTFAEMAPCGSASGLEWAIGNVLDAYKDIAGLVQFHQAVEVTQGSATQLSHLDDGSMTAVVVDPPYDDNVQYSELADFFYVWLKRTLGKHHRPEWFSTYLCDHREEAVVNHVRHLEGDRKPKEAKEEARRFYRKLMTESFREAKRVLRDDGVLTVMFTHKKQEAWAALFGSLIEAGFTITATWPIKTESQHSLHQASKNAAQSTVFLVARKRESGAGRGFYDAAMRKEIERAARNAAQRLEKDGLNAVDQLVGSFGPAMEVFSRYDSVVTDTGQPVEVAEALEIASDAVMGWRVDKLAGAGLEGVEPEARFALLFWDVLKAEEVRFNEVKLLGHAVGMDVERLVAAGLVTKTGDRVKVLPAKERRRDEPLTQEQAQTLFGPEIVAGKRRRKADALKVHPNDPAFRTALDACHAVALAYAEAGGGAAGIGVAKSLARRHGWSPDGPVARLMEALVKAAPVAVQFTKKKGDAADRFPEFRAWRDILKEVFAIEPAEWKPAKVELGNLFTSTESSDDLEDEVEEEENDSDE